MKKKLNLLIAAGALLVLAGFAAMLINDISAEKKLDAALQTAKKIEQMLPPASAGVEDLYSNADMASLTVDGTDYIALLSVKKYGVLLPIKNGWNSKTLSVCPQHFYGSCYSSNMAIGGSSLQFAFASMLDLGDEITVTDMLGAQFSYSVARIDRAHSAESEKLLGKDYPLTLFTRDEKTTDYIIVRCTKTV